MAKFGLSDNLELSAEVRGILTRSVLEPYKTVRARLRVSDAF